MPKCHYFKCYSVEYITNKSFVKNILSKFLFKFFETNQIKIRFGVLVKISKLIYK